MKRDRITGAVLIIIGIVALILTMQIPLDPEAVDPGSRLFPLIGSIGMIVFGLGTAVFSNKRKEDEKLMSREDAVRLGKVFLLFILFTVSLYYLGFLITAPFAIFALVTLFSYERKTDVIKRIVFSVVLTALIWVVFVKLLTVILPSGKLF